MLHKKISTPISGSWSSAWRVGFLAIGLFVSAGFVQGQETVLSEGNGQYKCGQPVEVSGPLIDEAEREQFNTRRVEISGSTYTRDREFRKRMVNGMSEGDIFTRAALEKSVRQVSRIRSIYDITMENIEIRLDREDRSIDIVFCVKQKPRRKTK